MPLHFGKLSASVEVKRLRNTDEIYRKANTNTSMNAQATHSFSPVTDSYTLAVIKVLLRLLWRLFSLSVVCLGLLILGVYSSFAYLEHYHHHAQDWLSQALQQPVKINAVRGEWDAWTPVLHISHSQFGENADGMSLAGFKQARMRVDLMASLLQGQLITQDIYLQNAYFTLQESNGRVGLRGLPQAERQEPAQPASAHTSYQQLLNWFLQQSHIQLQQAQFIWQAEQQPPVRFSQMDLRLTRHSGQEYALAGALQLPAQRYAPPLAAGLGLSSQGGRLAFQAQTHWVQQRLHDLQGQFHIHNLQLASKQAELVLPKVAAEIHWQPLNVASTGQDNTAQAQGWQMQVDNFSFATLEDTWPPSRMQILATPNAATSSLEWQGQIGFLRLHELVPLLSGLSLLPADLRHALSITRPQAELHTTHFLLQPDYWELRTHFRQASNRPWRHLPGLKNFAGVLSLNPKVGSLTFNSQAVNVAAPRLLAEPIQLDSLQGTVTWQHQITPKDKWVLHTSGLQLRNADAENIHVQGKLLLLSNGDAPQADLYIEGQNILVNRLQRYVPLNAAQTRRWMRKALLGGVIEQAEFHLTGPLQHQHLLLQATGQSGLQGHLQVRNGKIQYETGWPVLEQVQGELHIDGDTLLVAGKRGQIMRHRLYDTQVELRDLDSRSKYIRIQGYSEGDAADALRFIQNSPLSRSVDVGDLRITGPVKIDLDMRIPLSPGRRYTRGTVHFSDSRLSDGTLDKWRLALHKLRGELHFSDKSLAADGMQAELLDKPVRLSLQRLPNEQAPNAPKSVQINASGTADRGFLQQLFKRLVPELEPWMQAFSGTAQWQARLQLADDKTQPAQLRVTSNLQGATLDMPAPFGKTAAERRELLFQTPLGKRALGRLRYAKAFNLAYQGEAVALYFGNRAAELKPQAGWQLSGYLPVIEVSAWQAFFCQVQNCAAATSNTPSNHASSEQPFTRLRQQLHGKTLLLDISTEQLRLDQHRLQQVQVQGFANAERGLLQFNSQQAQGKLDYTQQPPQVNLLLTKLHLPHEKPSQQAVQNLLPQHYVKAMQRLTQQHAIADPRYLPPLSLYCESLKFGDIELGSLALQAAPSPQGFSLKHLNLNTASFNAQASGLWAYRKQSNLSTAPDTQSTQFEAHLYAEDFAQALAQLGQRESAIQGGQTQVHFRGNWPGNPLQFHQAHLKGKLSIDIAKGQIEAVELGPAGRVVGLLDLNSLSHRLSLDFRDVFEKGFGFNKISGEFFLEGGHAYTDGIYVEGPIADLEISGRTGLLNHTYEQDVIVMPHVSNTLPVAGAVAGGPAVGVAVLVLQSLLKNDLKEAIQYHYRITGNWDAPQILLVKE